MKQKFLWSHTEPNCWLSFQVPSVQPWIGNLVAPRYFHVAKPMRPVELLTHWGWMTHICVIKVTIIGSNNGLSPGRCQAFIWTNAEILLIGPLGTNFSEILLEIYTFSFKKMHLKMSSGTNFSEILFEIYTFSFKKMHLKMSSGKWRPSCLGLNVLSHDPCLLHDKLLCINRRMDRQTYLQLMTIPLMINVWG